VIAMTMTRRHWLTSCAAAVPILAARTRAVMGAGEDRQPLGVVIHSYGLRVAASRSRGGPERFDDAMAFLDHAHALGASGVQVGIGARDDASCDRLRERASGYGMYLEGIVRLPADRDDLDRFAAEVRSASRAGATVLRTTMLGGRRYEMFATADAFRRAADAAVRSLTMAEPVASRNGVRLAVENHKDFRADDLAAILKRIGSEHFGACLDTGNSIALLEDPMETAEALAPWAVTTHIKDMAVREYEQGFLLSEVPLGEGFLDLARIVRMLRAARPEIRLNLEMITRDPLRVPCLSERYWATFEDLPGRFLARTLALVRARAATRPLPTVEGLSPEEKFRAEDENVHRCLASSRAVLKP
jgi:sugar phosphate isomerase/epimerase